MELLNEMNVSEYVTLISSLSTLCNQQGLDAFGQAMPILGNEERQNISKVVFSLTGIVLEKCKINHSMQIEPWTIGHNPLVFDSEMLRNIIFDEKASSL